MLEVNHAHLPALDANNKIVTIDIAVDQNNLTQPAQCLLVNGQVVRGGKISI
jgi:hypothetical protein